MSNKIKVAIKVRPPLEPERAAGLRSQWDVRSYAIARNAEQSLKRKRADAEKFYFDHIFNEESRNKDVFERVVKRIVSSAVDGYNGTIIAYGQSNSGKTHTMKGTEDDQGIIPLAIEHMFDQAKKLQHRKLAFRVSYFEIYNKRVNDLLDVKNTNLQLRKSLNSLVQVVGCKEELVHDVQSVFHILETGEQNRKTHESPMNKKNDKGHTILRINIENKESKSNYDSHNRFSQLNLVDLAGHKTFKNYHSKEDFHVNISLSILNLIIVQLNKLSDTQKCINYRESKLTECLLSSFGGNARTAFICTISPVALEETQNTLWFASRTLNVKNKPKLNIILFYKLELVKKICRFHRFLQAKMKKLLDKLIQIQEENKLVCQNNPANCRIPRIMRIINNNRFKFSVDSVIPVVNEDDLFSALQQFKLDLEKLHDKLEYLADCINIDEDILNVLQNIESDLEHLEPKSMLLETFINILIED